MIKSRISIGRRKKPPVRKPLPKKMRLTAESIVDAIDEFENECVRGEHTRVTDAWDLLYEIRKQLREFYK